jgi:BASS family bile acid:Na+ symporter
VAAALKRCPLGRITFVNFIAIPAIAFALNRLLLLPEEIGAALMLLAAAPFAPVVPTFTRLVKGDLALAVALTGLFSVLSGFLTPLICAIGMTLQFDFVSALVVLFFTITFPLALGIAANHFFPRLSGKIFKPIQVLSEATGAAGLALVTVSEFAMILALGWRTALAIALLSELSFLAGWFSAGPQRNSRIVVALGSANRNIALALLIAVQNFPGSATAAAVAGCGLVLILFGLVHVGCIRFAFKDPGV